MISKKTGRFTRFSQFASHITGRPVAFFGAVAIIVVWALAGPLFGYSDTWQLVINTGTTIVTFLMVFVIQNTQNRDTAAMHIKVDELIRVTEKARKMLLNLEELDESDLEALRQDYERLAVEGRHRFHTKSRLMAEAGEAPPKSRSPSKLRSRKSKT